MALSFLLHNLPRGDVHKGAVLTPCADSSCTMREMTSLLFSEKGKDTLSKFQDDEDCSCSWEYCSEMQAVMGYSCHGDHHTMPMLLRHHPRGEYSRGRVDSRLNTTLAGVGDLPQTSFGNLGICKLISSLTLFICFVYLAFSGFMMGVTSQGD